MNNIEISITKDFSETPGARYKNEGKYSGQEFREKILEPKYILAKANKIKIVVNFDGGYGYATSFIEEAFGGLSRLYPRDDVLSMFEFVSEDEPALVEDVKTYINNAKKVVDR